MKSAIKLGEKKNETTVLFLFTTTKKIKINKTKEKYSPQKKKPTWMHVSGKM